MRVKFTANYDHKVNRNVIVAYKAGHEATLPTAHAERAIALGKAVALDAATPAEKPARARARE